MAIAEFAKMDKGKTADFVVISTEATQNECREYRHMVFFVDVTARRRPFSVSNFDVPEAERRFLLAAAVASAPTATQRDRSRRSTTSGSMFVSYFNAGVEQSTSATRTAQRDWLLHSGDHR